MKKLLPFFKFIELSLRIIFFNNYRYIQKIKKEGFDEGVKRNKEIFNGGLLIVLFIFLSAVASATWWIEDIDAPKYFSNFKSRTIALDTSDRPHIAYGCNHLYHAYFDGTQWQYEVVDNAGGVGAVASIAVDSNNNLVYTSCFLLSKMLGSHRRGRYQQTCSI